MKLEPVLALIIASALLASTLNVVHCTSSGNPTPFSLSEINAGIRITSPISNTTYNETTVILEVTLYLGATEWVPGSHVIPYQEISCVYSLDNGEWKNTLLNSTTKKEPWQSLVNAWWFNQMESKYNVVLQNLSEGLHFIKVAAKPDSLRSNNYYERDLEPSVNFTIKQSPTPTLSPLPELGPQQPEPNYLAAGAVTSIVAVTSFGLIVYFKKRSRGQST